jgi:hypothetical protein
VLTIPNKPKSKEYKYISKWGKQNDIDGRCKK